MCPPHIPPLLPIIGQTAAAAPYAFPGNHARLHLHASAPASGALTVGHIAAGGATRVPGSCLRDATRGHTYALRRREADVLINRHWPRRRRSARQCHPLGSCQRDAHLPRPLLAALPLDDRHAASNELARYFAGTDDRVLAFDATRGKWWHVADLAFFQAIGFAWDDVTAAAAEFVGRTAAERTTPIPQIIGQAAAATAAAVPGDRMVLQRRNPAATAAVVAVGAWLPTGQRSPRAALFATPTARRIGPSSAARPMA